MGHFAAATETIFAPATAPGRAGVAVIRLSGPKTAIIVTALAGRVPPARQAVLTALTFGGELIDRALLLWFPSPRSYTGEDMAEIQVHGGRAVLQALTLALSASGARAAEPGEFTRRAVLNGKLDLTAAEAVADLVNAETLWQRRQALRQLEGGLADLYRGWQQRLIRLLAHFEAGIDFTDEDLPPALRLEIHQALLQLAGEMRRHLAAGQAGERLRDGLTIAITGAPNAGKSTLLNRLAARDVAIVTPVPGTTRDVLEVAADVAGYPVTFADTAGLRETADEIEAEGVRRARARGATADIRLLLFDAAAGPAPDPATLAAAGDINLWVVNKCDIADPAALKRQLEVLRPDIPVHLLAAVTGVGLPELLVAIAAQAEQLMGLHEAPGLTRARHRAQVASCLEHLDRALLVDRRMASDMPADELQAEDLRLALRALGRILGQTGVETLLDIVFRDFCIGK